MKNNLFIHIPKTAGSSFRETIKHNYKYITRIGIGGNVCKFEDSVVLKENSDRLKKISKSSDYDFHEKSLIMGHIVYEKDLEKKFDLYTLIRNPIEHFLSNLLFFYFEKKQENKFISFLEKHHQFSLKQDEIDYKNILILIKHNLLVSNPLVKTFAGIPYNKFFFGLNDIKISKNELLIAKENASKFKLIGSSKNFNEFLNSFCKLNNLDIPKINLSRVTNYPREYRENLLKELSSSILEYNSFDYDFYNFYNRNYNKKV